jgi:hypothetical protein
MPAGRLFDDLFEARASTLELHALFDHRVSPAAVAAFDFYDGADDRIRTGDRLDHY